MIQRIALFAAACAALSACSGSADNAAGNEAANAANTTAATANVVLPPAIKDSRTYRCKDNSIFYASYLADDTTVNVRDKEEEPPVAVLKATAPGEPFEGTDKDGKTFKLVGSGDNVTYTSPDSGTQTCRSGKAK